MAGWIVSVWITVLALAAAFVWFYQGSHRSSVGYLAYLLWLGNSSHMGELPTVCQEFLFQPHGLGGYCGLWLLAAVPLVKNRYMLINGFCCLS